MCQTPISDHEEITGMEHALPFQTTRKPDKIYETIFRLWDSRHSRIVIMKRRETNEVRFKITLSLYLQALFSPWHREREDRSRMWWFCYIAKVDIGVWGI